MFGVKNAKYKNIQGGVMVKKPAEELKSTPYPECMELCDLIRILGDGECENIQVCKHKFASEGRAGRECR